MEDYVKADLVNLIKDLTGETKLSPMIQGQIQRYVLELGMSFKEIARCLVYWVEVKGQSLSPAYGIGIVPSIRKPAADYFKQLELEREEQVKQAKIDVLNELKEKYFSSSSINSRINIIFENDIDKMIEELKK